MSPRSAGLLNSQAMAMDIINLSYVYVWAGTACYSYKGGQIHLFGEMVRGK